MGQLRDSPVDFTEADLVHMLVASRCRTEADKAISVGLILPSGSDHWDVIYGTDYVNLRYIAVPDASSFVRMNCGFLFGDEHLPTASIVLSTFNK
jgi:hypothetical protein